MHFELIFYLILIAVTRKRQTDKCHFNFQLRKIHIYNNSEGMYLTTTENNDHVCDMTGIWHAQGAR